MDVTLIIQGYTISFRILAIANFSQLVKLDSDIFACWLILKGLQSLIWWSRTYLYPCVHLCDQEVKAFMSFRFFIQNKFTPHIVQFEEFDSDCITVCHERLRPLNALQLTLLDFNEKVLQGINQRFKFNWPASAHVAKRIHPSPNHWMSPNGLQYHIQKAVVLIAQIAQTEFLAYLRALLQNCKVLFLMTNLVLVMFILFVISVLNIRSILLLVSNAVMSLSTLNSIWLRIHRININIAVLTLKLLAIAL